MPSRSNLVRKNQLREGVKGSRKLVRHAFPSCALFCNHLVCMTLNDSAQIESRLDIPPRLSVCLLSFSIFMKRQQSKTKFLCVCYEIKNIDNVRNDSHGGWWWLVVVVAVGPA
uniref:Uncharacterized protein n=1 Tax=Glossina palpalis gambiensis TaxID=67801 RepID=A0A1B0AZ70_9MUSC